MLLFIQQNLQAGGISASAALVEGADTLAAQVAISVAASLAQTDGADVLSAQVAPSVAASSATTDGADVLAASVGVRVAASAALVEGADTLAALVGVGIAVSLAQTEGDDVLAASVSIAGGGATDFSAAWTDGADVLEAAIGTSSAGGGYDDAPKRKKRFVVEQDGKLLVFGSARAAVAALGQQKAIEAVAIESPAEEVAEISLPAVQAYAEVRGLVDDYQAALRNRHYLALIAMLMDMRDEDDVELLLMHA